jgi:hypothetical protein
MRVRAGSVVVAVLFAGGAMGCGVKIGPTPPLTIGEVKARLLTPAEVGPSWATQPPDTSSTSSTSSKGRDSCSSIGEGPQSPLGTKAEVSFTPRTSGGSTDSFTVETASEGIASASSTRVVADYARFVQELQGCRTVHDTSSGAKIGSIVPIRLKSYGAESQAFRLTANALFLTIRADLIVARQDNVLVYLLYGGSETPSPAAVEAFADKAAAKAFDVPLSLAASGTTAPPTTADPLVASCSQQLGETPSSTPDPSTTTTVVSTSPALTPHLLGPADLPGSGWEASPADNSSGSGAPDPTVEAMASFPVRGSVSLERSSSDPVSGSVDESLGVAADASTASAGFAEGASALQHFVSLLQQCTSDDNVALPFAMTLKPSSVPVGGDESRVWSGTFSIPAFSQLDSSQSAPTSIPFHLALIRKGRSVVLLAVTSDSVVTSFQPIAAAALAKL